MTALLKLCAMIDGLNLRIGKSVTWLILLMVIISSGNATIRYLFDNSSNAWLELQWYLFSAVFLLGAGYTLQKNEHIRIDVVSGRLSRRTQLLIDIFGTVLFLMPMAILIGVLSWPMVVESYNLHEVSDNAGGLLRWPAKALIPAGFFLLVLQGVSELIKKIAILSGAMADPDPHGGDHAHQDAAEEGSV